MMTFAILLIEHYEINPNTINKVDTLVSSKCRGHLIDKYEFNQYYFKTLKTNTIFNSQKNFSM